jgi:hypothetical protein
LPPYDPHPPPPPPHKKNKKIKKKKKKTLIVALVSTKERTHTTKKVVSQLQDNLALGQQTQGEKLLDMYNNTGKRNQRKRNNIKLRPTLPAWPLCKII